MKRSSSGSCSSQAGRDACPKRSQAMPVYAAPAPAMRPAPHANRRPTDRTTVSCFMHEVCAISRPADLDRNSLRVPDFRHDPTDVFFLERSALFLRLLTTPWFTIHTFGVLLALAYLSALFWLVRSARRAGLNPDAVLSLGGWAIVGALIGAKALLVLRSWSEYAQNPSELLSMSLLTSAGDFYGGFIGGLVAAGLFFVRSEGARVG